MQSFLQEGLQKGMNSIDENPLYGAMNMDIAAGTNP